MFTSKKQKGQSLVEVSAGLVLMIILLSVTVDLGRAYFTGVALEDAAGEAAIYLAMNPSCPYDELINDVPVADNGIDDGCNAPSNATWRAQNAATEILNNSEMLMISEITDSAEGTGDIVKVTINYKLKMISPFVSAILPELTLTSSATQTVFCEGSNCLD